MFKKALRSKGLKGLFIVGVILSSFLLVAPATSQESQYEVRVIGQLVNVRAMPSAQSTVLFQVDYGEILRPIKEEGNWYLVEASNSRQGYIHYGLVKLIEPSLPPLNFGAVRAVKLSGEAFGNSDVIALAQAGLSDDIIIAKIQQAPSVEFDLSTNGLVALKNAGVSEPVIWTIMTLSKESITQNPESKPIATPTVVDIDSPSQKQLLQPTKATPKVPGQLGAGLSMGVSSVGVGPNVLYDVNNKVTMRTGVGMLSGITAFQSGLMYRFPQAVKNPPSNITFEPFVSGGLTLVKWDYGFTSESSVGFCGSAGSFLRFTSFPRWRFSGEVEYFNLDMSLKGFGMRTGVHYFF